MAKGLDLNGLRSRLVDKSHFSDEEYGTKCAAAIKSHKNTCKMMHYLEALRTMREM